METTLFSKSIMSSNRSLRGSTHQSGHTSPPLPASRSDYSDHRASPSLRSSAIREHDEERAPSPLYPRLPSSRQESEDRVGSPRLNDRSSLKRSPAEARSRSPPLRSSVSNPRLSGLRPTDEERVGSPIPNARSSFKRSPDEVRSGSPPLRPSISNLRSSDLRTTDKERAGSPPLRTSTIRPRDEGRIGSPTTNPRSSFQRPSDEGRSSSPSLGRAGLNSRLSDLRSTDTSKRIGSPVSNSRASLNPPISEERSSSPSARTSPFNSRMSLGGKTKPSASTNRASLLREKDNERSESPSRKFTPREMEFHRAAFERCLSTPEQRVLRSREKFNLALNYAGYDLPKSKVDELWSQNDHEVTYSTFERILREEKPIDEQALQEAFDILYNKERKATWSTIDFDRFRTDLIEKGDKFTEEEFEGIRLLLGTRDGKIDIKQLTQKIIDNRRDCQQEILIEKKEEKKIKEESRTHSPPDRLHSPLHNARGGRGNKVKVSIEPSPSKLHISDDGKKVQMKGAFFCEQFDAPAKTFYYSLGYSFELKKSTPIWIILEPKISGSYHKDKSFEQLDVRLLLFEILPDSKRRLIRINTTRSKNKSYIHLTNLERGSYEVLPLTFGGLLQPRSKTVNDRPPIKALREHKKGRPPSMSGAYRKVLEFIFDLFDLDDNHQLDRNEYNLLTKRMTNDEITDEDWLTIQENFRLDKEQNISKDTFLKMNEFEVQSEETTDEELWNGVKAIGFNYALELDMMCPFELTFHLNRMDLHVTPTAFVELSEIKKPLLKFLMEQCSRIRLNIPGVQCLHYEDPCGSILFVENKSESNVTLTIQATNVKNAALTLPLHGRKPPTIYVRHNSQEIVWFAHPLDFGQTMEIEASVQPAE